MEWLAFLSAAAAGAFAVWCALAPMESHKRKAKRGAFINQPTYPSAIASVIVVTLPAALLALLIFYLGWNDTIGGPQSTYAPAGYVVAAIWVLLFASLGLVRWQLAGRGERYLSNLVVALVVLCTVYPFYTMGLKSGWVAFAGTVSTLAYALFVWMQMGAHRRNRLLLLPLIAWLLFASYLTIMTI